MQIALKIVDKGGNYLRVVKGNYKTLLNDLNELLKGCDGVGCQDVPYDRAQSLGKGHVRIKIWRCQI